MNNINELTDIELLTIYQNIQDFIKYLNNEKDTLEKSGDENA